MEKHLSYRGKVCVIRKDRQGVVIVTDADGHSATVEIHNEIGGSFQVRTSGGRAPGGACRGNESTWVRWQGRTFKLEIEQTGGARKKGGKSAGDLSSPMPGQVIKLLVEPGASVRAGEALMIVEAMKMQLEIKAPSEGVVKRFRHQAGDAIGAGEPLVDLEANE